MITKSLYEAQTALRQAYEALVRTSEQQKAKGMSGGALHAQSVARRVARLDNEIERMRPFATEPYDIDQAKA